MAMTMTGEATLPAARPKVWALLNDPDVLKACIPGCQSLEKAGDNGFAAVVKTKIGPVAATFKGKVELSDIVPDVGYTISGEGEGGVAGFAKGAAKVSLADAEGGTLLRYDVEAHVGGKIAQLGSRLIDGVAKGMADKFFASFAEAAGAPRRRSRAQGDPNSNQRGGGKRNGARRRAASPQEEVMVQEDMGMVHVSMTVNGRQVSAEVDPRTLLVQFLRENLRLTGTHVGCDTSQCGACVVHVDGEAIKSCTTLAVSCDGAERHDDRGPRAGRQAASDAAGVPGQSRPAVRLLHAGHDHGGDRPRQSRGHATRRSDDPARARRQHLPLHRLPQHRQGGRSRARAKWAPRRRPRPPNKRTTSRQFQGRET